MGMQLKTRYMHEAVKTGVPLMAHSWVAGICALWPRLRCTQPCIRSSACSPSPDTVQVVGDVFSVFWGAIFGESATNYVPKADCDIFHCPERTSS